MINKTARTLGMSVLAGSMVLGMSACTKVESKANDATSKATSAANSATDSAGASNSAEQPSSDTSAPSSDTSSDTATDGGSAGGLTTGKVGQEVKTSDMTVKITKITDPVKPTDDYTKPDAGKHFVGVNITATNQGSKPLAFGESCLNVKLTDNTTPKRDFMSSYGSDLGFQNLQKGDTASGDIVYQVPDGQKIKTIDVDCNEFDETPGVRISN